MKKVLKFAGVYATGGLGYGALEIMFRGRTHWSMLIAGGICFSLLYLIAARSRAKHWEKWIMGGAVITTVEFISGIVVNLKLGWNVWSYAGQPFNFMGQICPLFSLLWVLLSIPVITLVEFLEGRTRN